MLATERIGRVFVATLAHVPVNALNDALIDRLDTVLDQVAADAEIAVLHIRSRLNAFCAGADLAAMHACFGTAEGPDAMLDVVRRMQGIFQRLETAAAVTIAEVGGAAVGGGLELALACDLRVVAAEAKLGLPEVGLGLLPAAGGTQRLTRLCGQGIAKRLIFGAEVIDGVEAERIGIAQWVRPRDQLAAWTNELVARIAAMPRAALVAAKRCIAAEADPHRDGYIEEIAATRDLYDHEETRSKVSEFIANAAVRHGTKEMR
jgi:enoyl-CoA hydratase/carnithine racemase